jgi:hypothetical protein
MAKYRKGVPGPFRGTVGTVVGSKWKGIDYKHGFSGPLRININETMKLFTEPKN